MSNEKSSSMLSSEVSQTSASRFQARPYSVVTPVSQVVLQIEDGKSQGAFKLARRLVLEWIQERSGRPLPKKAWSGDDFELDEVGSQRAAAVKIGNQFWAARLDDSDDSVAKRNWVTEISIGSDADNTIVFGAKLQCVDMGEGAPISSSIPRFIREIVRKVPNVQLEDCYLSFDPWLATSEKDINDLFRLINDPRRKLDVVVCALPEDSEDISDALFDAKKFHRRTLGACHFAAITGPASFFLSDLVGREFSVFRGAVRTYKSNFDVSLDEPSRHPLTLPYRIKTWVETNDTPYDEFLISKTIARSSSDRSQRQKIPAFTEVRRLAAQRRMESARQSGTSDVELLKIAEEEIIKLRESLEQDRQTYQGLVDQYERERDAALDEAQAAKATNANLKARIRSLSMDLSAKVANSDSAQIPQNLDNFEDWCRGTLSGAVELHNRAYQGVKKSLYSDQSLIYKSLLLLRDFYVPMRREGGLELKEKFESECKALGLVEEPTFSGDRWGEQGETYKVRYAGRQVLLDRHLKKGTSREERHCFRLYFFWDDEAEQCIVGWLPSHLDTRAT